VGAEGSLGKRVGGGGGGHGHDHVRAKDLIGRTRRRKPKMFGAHPVRVSGSHTVNYFVGIWRSTTDNRIKLSCHKKQLDQPCTLPKPGPQNTNRCYTLAMTSFPPPSGFNHSPSSHWEPPSSRLPRSPSTHSKTSRTPSARPGHDESSHASLADRCRPYRGESRSDTARASFSRRSMLHCLRFTWDAPGRKMKPTLHAAAAAATPTHAPCRGWGLSSCRDLQTYIALPCQPHNKKLSLSSEDSLHTFPCTPRFSELGLVGMGPERTFLKNIPCMQLRCLQTNPERCRRRQSHHPAAPAVRTGSTKNKQSVGARGATEHSLFRDACGKSKQPLFVE